MKKHTRTVNDVIKSWKNLIKRFGTVEGKTKQKDIDILSEFIRNNEDDTMVGIVYDIMSAATRFPIDNSGLQKAIRRYMRETDCINTARSSYRKISRSMRYERVDFMDGMLLRNIDPSLEDGAKARKLRRIVEKRTCQAWHRRYHGKGEGNKVRSEFRRATSYQVNSLGQIELDRYTRRTASSHWSRGYDPISRTHLLKPKVGYATLEEAQRVAIANNIRHEGENVGEAAAYKCAECGRYHIGHNYRLISYLAC